MRRLAAPALASLGLLLFCLWLPAAWRAAGLSPLQFVHFARVLGAAPWPGEGVRLVPLLASHLAAAGFWLLLLGGGLASARFWQPGRAAGLGDRAEAALLTWGLVAWSTFLLFALRLGPLTLPLALVLLAAGPLAGASAWRPKFTIRNFRPKFRLRTRPAGGGLDTLLLALATLAALLAALSANLPVHQSDALAYHAAVPRACVEAGRLVDFPYSIRAHFPMLAGMLSAPAFALGIESGPRLVHAAFFVITLLLLRDLAGELAGRRAGLWAAAAFACLACAPSLAAYGFVDYAAIAYLLAALRRLFRLAREGDGATAGVAKIALLLGMAAATKLSILPSLLPLAAWAAWRALTASSSLPRVRALLLWTMLGLLPLLPWMVRNAAVAGNPCLPFLAGVLESPRWSPTDALLYRAHAERKGGLWEWRQAGLMPRLFDLAVLPARTAAAPLQGHPGLAGRPERWLGDWPIGPLAFAFSPLLLLLAFQSRRRAALGLALYALYLYLVWAVSYRDLRFLLPFLSVYLALLAVLLFSDEKRPAGLAAWLTLPALLAQAGMAALLALHATAAATPAGRAPLAMVLGYVDRTDFLAQKVPDNFTPALLWMQTQAQREAAGGRALLVGLHQGYHLRFPHLAGDFFNPCPLLTWAEGADTVEALEARLAAEGITHVIFTGETLANPAYHFWFLLHALPEPEVREALAGRGAVPLARAASTPAYRVISAWLAAAPGLVRVYPEADPPPALAPTPWNLPASTVIYRRNSQSSPEVSENTHLRP